MAMTGLLKLCLKNTIYQEILCRLLVNRGVTLETTATYLKPNLRDLLPNPSILLDMDKAIERMVKALENNEKIAVYGGL